MTIQKLLFTEQFLYGMIHYESVLEVAMLESLGGVTIVLLLFGLSGLASVGGDVVIGSFVTRGREVGVRAGVTLTLIIITLGLLFLALLARR